MSLTSRIQALTAYANEATGASDTTLADAVATLAGGYGQGGWSVDGIASNQEPSGAIVVNVDVATYAFYNKSMITSIHVKGRVTTNSLAGMTGIVTAVLEKMVGSGNYILASNSNLTTIDIVMSTTGKITGSRVFQNCSDLTTMILRQATFCEVATQAFTASPAASGGAGITVYVPASLKATYEADSVWSGLAVTFASIEGSIYETQYADGTPIE